jgi:hypothetical protein
VCRRNGLLPNDPFTALTLITGPAILTNACAILQNGATMRYNLAITQWREFRASLAADDDRLALLFVDPDRALVLAERRIHLQLRALGLLNAGVALFAATTACGLIAAFLDRALAVPAHPVGLVMVVAGTAALGTMLAAIGALYLEGACGRAMIRLHPLASARPAGRAATSPTALGRTS